MKIYIKIDLNECTLDEFREQSGKNIQIEEKDGEVKFFYTENLAHE